MEQVQSSRRVRLDLHQTHAETILTHSIHFVKVSAHRPTQRRPNADDHGSRLWSPAPRRPVSDIRRLLSVKNDQLVLEITNGRKACYHTSDVMWCWNIKCKMWLSLKSISLCNNSSCVIIWRYCSHLSNEKNLQTYVQTKLERLGLNYIMYEVRENC